MAVLEETKAIEFQEEGLLVKTLTSERDLNASYRLRHEVFANRLEWVAKTDDGLEIDAYDTFATSIGLFDDAQKLRGIFRMVRSPYPFMMEREFRSCLPPGYEIRKGHDTAEITRLALDPTLTDKGLSSRLMLIIIKGVYQWSRQNEIPYMYMVVEKRFLRVLRGIGLSCEAISTAVSLPPAGAVSIAALLNWQDFYETCPLKQPSFFQWMNTVDGSIVFERSGFLARDPRESVAEFGIGQARRKDQQPSSEVGGRLVAA